MFAKRGPSGLSALEYLEQRGKGQKPGTQKSGEMLMENLGVLAMADSCGVGTGQVLGGVRTSSRTVFFYDEPTVTPLSPSIKTERRLKTV